MVEQAFIGHVFLGPLLFRSLNLVFSSVEFNNHNNLRISQISKLIIHANYLLINEFVTEAKLKNLWKLEILFVKTCRQCMI